MAYVIEPEVVKYACTCGTLKLISRLYLCRHCMELRCAYCVCHEVDSHFCGRCLENLPSSEARLKKNRCGSCFDCPGCMQNLSLRAVTAGQKNQEESKSPPRKLYYLLCLNCRWSSRDVGIPEQQSTTGWPERENVNINRLQKVQDMYKQQVLLEKQQILDKDKKKQRKYLSYTDKTGITASLLRKRIGLSDTPHPLAKPKAKVLEPSTAKTYVETLPDDIFTKPIKLSEITTIQQRLFNPDHQPTTVDKLFPVHKQLSVKHTLRCRNCEHNVSKPEYNPSSIKFKIQLFAYYHIPEIRIVTIEPLRAGKTSELLLKFINPTQYETSIALLPFSVAGTSEDEKQEQTVSKINLLPSNEVASVLPTKSHSVKPKLITEEITAAIELPSKMFTLPLRDDAAEYDDLGDSHSFQDDAKFVVWRKSNKAVVKLFVTPKKESKIGDAVVVGFTMKHLYINTIISQKNEHNINIFLTLGNLVGSE